MENNKIFYIILSLSLASVAAEMDVGAINLNETSFFMVDMQTGFNSCQQFIQVKRVANIMINAANLLSIPVFASEHTPNVYGHTDPEIDMSGVFAYEKDTFNMFNEKVRKEIPLDKNITSVVLFGVEAHICVEQSAMEFLKQGFKVHIVQEGVSSVSLMDRRWALKRLSKIGCHIETVESVLYKLVKGTTHPKHDSIVAIIENSVPNQAFEH